MTSRWTIPLAMLALVGGCNVLGDAEAQAEREVRTKLNLLQISIEDTLPRGGIAAIAVVAVVDSSALSAAAAEEADPIALEEARYRERVVRQEISNRFVENKLISVVQPAEQTISQARDEIVAKNSAALSAPLAAEIGEALGVELIVCALIEQEGAAVNVVAQRVRDGHLVYQDTIGHWAVLAPATAEE